MNKLLTAQEVADLLSVGKKTIYQLKASGQIPYIKIGGIIRFDREQIEKWLAKKGGCNE